MTRRTLAALAAITLAVSLAACGSDDTTSDATTSPTTPDTSAPTTVPATDAASSVPATDAATTTTRITEAPEDTVIGDPGMPPYTGPVPVPPPASTVDGILALGEPVILAHAGGENTAPHSTPYAFMEAAAVGVDILDFDVRLTGDGVIVVQHDATTGRTANDDLDVYTSTYDELHALDNAYWFTTDCTCTDQPDDAYLLRGMRTGDVEPPVGFVPDDYAITAFADFIDGYPDWVLNIEIKADGAEGIATADALAELIAEKDAADRVVVTSFDDKVVRHFHRLLSDVVMTPGLQMSTDFVLSGVVPPPWAPILQVPPVYEGIEVFTPDYVAASHAAGLPTWVWPNGEGEDVDGYLALLEMGADGVNASDPAAGVQALREFLAAQS